MRHRKFSTKRIVLTSLFAACGLIMFMLENLLPPLLIPGAKLGLSNIFSLAALIVLGPIEGITVLVVRTVIGSLFGNVSTLIYSLSAGLVSIFLEWLLLRFVFPRVSLIAVSVCGGVTHNIVQNIIFSLVTASPQTLVYLPYLLILGAISGFVVGAVVLLTIKRIPSTLIKLDLSFSG